jgi:hypothetical protein
MNWREITPAHPQISSPLEHLTQLPLNMRIHPADTRIEPDASRSRTVAGTCPQVSDRLLGRPREYEIDQAGVLW